MREDTRIGRLIEPVITARRDDPRNEIQGTC